MIFIFIKPAAFRALGVAAPALLLLLLGGGLRAEETPARDRERALEDRVRELERTVEILAEELERTRAELAVPEEPELESRHGLGPAASKIYGVVRGLSIGGYAEGAYRGLVDDSGTGSDEIDFTRAVLYVGHKFSDRILFNSELELEHASTSEAGSFSVEFATLDFLWRDEANLRAGLMLVPMGFLNEMHEPPFFYGVNRPEVEQRIIPSTWRENGLGLFGRLGDAVEYRVYAVNGLDATGFRASGLRGGRQKGSEALAEHFAAVARVDWFPIEPLQIGGSVYHGSSGQNQALMGLPIPDTPTTIWEVHAQYRARGLHLRGLFSMAHLDDTPALGAALSAALGSPVTVGREMLGAYGEVAYDVLPWLWPESEASLEPFYRFEFLDTHHDVRGAARDPAQEKTFHTVGVSFEPIPNVVIKADYRNGDAESGEIADEFNLGLGLVF